LQQLLKFTTDFSKRQNSYSQPTMPGAAKVRLE
jgi:hypothetical protein